MKRLKSGYYENTTIKCKIIYLYSIDNMNTINYLSDSKFGKSMEYMDLKIKTLLINGIIYRGEWNVPLILPKKPKFYGSMESAIEYISENKYLVIYKTNKPLRLLDLSLNDENIESIKYFFLEYLMNKFPNQSTDIKMIYIFIQIAFGLIKNNMTYLNLCELDPSLIYNYAKVNNIKKKDINLLEKIMTVHIFDTTIIPTRVSTKGIDKMIMRKMAQFCEPLNIDGCFHNNKNTYDKISACKIFSQYFTGTLCVPPELTIFKPILNLKVIETLKKKNNKYHNINIHRDQNRYKYKKYLAKNKMFNKL